MKTTKNFLTLALVLFAVASFAQQPELQFYRPWNKDGINVFEPAKKTEQPEYDGFKLRIGGAFTQYYQRMYHENNPNGKNYLYGTIASENETKSADLNGFSLAMANLNFDFQIEDGIRVCLENYMSARHHNEFWVKGGYIQIDKLPMLGNPDWYAKNFRVKIGHFQPNYGDQQFRRTDGGNAIYNPFGENFILDAFTTEIGGEVSAFPVDGLALIAGMTSGLISGNIENYPEKPIGSNLEPTKRNPSIYLKAAYDKQVNDDLRVRLSASTYQNSSIVRNTLYAGDRTGSHYFMVMEPNTTGVTATTNFTSGRFNPGLTNRVSAVMINPFVKFKGLELFGAYEIAQGGTYTEANDRKWTQFVAEGVFRFLPNEQAYIGARYNTTTGRPSGTAYTADVTIERTSLVAGWFPTRNLLLKGELVSQKYIDFPTSVIFNEGKFNGLLIEAVIGF
jgi:hypothetical protein